MQIVCKSVCPESKQRDLAYEPYSKSISWQISIATHCQIVSWGFPKPQPVEIEVHQPSELKTKATECRYRVQLQCPPDKRTTIM